MSEENVEVVVAYFQAGDVRAAFEAISEDVTFTFHGEARRLSGAEELVGKAAALKWMVDWFSRFRDYHFEIEEALDWAIGSLWLPPTTPRDAPAVRRFVSRRRR